MNEIVKIHRRTRPLVCQYSCGEFGLSPDLVTMKELSNEELGFFIRMCAGEIDDPLHEYVRHLWRGLERLNLGAVARVQVMNNPSGKMIWEVVCAVAQGAPWATEEEKQQALSKAAQEYADFEYNGFDLDERLES